jgi:hypothetical protein
MFVGLGAACGNGSNEADDDLVGDAYLDCGRDSCRVLYLYISNQSFADPDVAISIMVDGKQVLSDTFDVRGQHHWVLFTLVLEKGAHTLTARAGGHDADIDLAFTLDDPPTWGVLNFWFDEENGPRFRFYVSDERPVFG